MKLIAKSIVHDEDRWVVVMEWRVDDDRDMNREWRIEEVNRHLQPLVRNIDFKPQMGGIAFTDQDHALWCYMKFAG